MTSVRSLGSWPSLCVCVCVCVFYLPQTLYQPSTTAHNLVETRRKVPDVGRVESSHRDPPIAGQVNMRLLH